jgi:mono/diheme cytochrome c family protein
MISLRAAAAVLAALAGTFVREEAPEQRETIARGRYLVHHVAMCVQCHTPRDENGELVLARVLQGSVVPVERPFASLPWAFRAPHIAGLPGYSDAEAMRLLTEGIAANGRRPLPPMPPFRLASEDARAVVAYLRSID